jgi:hypothetical protein
MDGLEKPRISARFAVRLRKNGGFPPFFEKARDSGVKRNLFIEV